MISALAMRVKSNRAFEPVRTNHGGNSVSGRQMNGKKITVGWFRTRLIVAGGCVFRAFVSVSSRTDYYFHWNKSARTTELLILV